MARLDDALGIFREHSYVDPEAPPTDNGLDPATGWARGVIEDTNSPSGYSYNGIPTNTDGSRFEPKQTTPTQYPLEPTYSGSGSLAPVGDIFQQLFKGGMPQAQPQPPVSKFAIGGDWAQPELEVQQPLDPYLQMADASTQAYPAVNAISDFANRMTPQLPVQPPTNQNFIDIDRALDTTSGAGMGDLTNWSPLRDMAGNIIPDDPNATWNPATNPETAREARFGSAHSADAELAMGALGAMDAPRKYGVAPFIGNLAQNVNSPREAISGLMNIPALAGQTIADTLNPKDDFAGYKSGLKTNEDFLNNESVPWPVRTGVKALEDPMTYAGALGLNKLGKNVGGIAGGLIEQGGPANIVGSYLGSEAATRYGESVPGFNKQPELLQGLEGGILGFGGPGAIKNGVRLIDSTSKGVVNGMITLDALLNEPKPGEMGGISVPKKGSPVSSFIDNGQMSIAPKMEGGAEFRTGPGPDGELRPFKKVITEGIPVTNDDLHKVTFVHSTSDTDFKLPDPEHGVRRITQGPGTYLTTDYKSGEDYGARAFTSEFDGNAMILADEANPQEWENIAAQIAEKLRSIGVEPRNTDNAFTPERLGEKRWSVEKTPTNNYGYRDALVDAITYDLYRGSIPENVEPILTRFKKVVQGGGSTNEADGKALVADTLADNGYDAAFHLSTADGDTLIVLNGESMRVTGELHKGHALIEDGMNIRDVMQKADAGKKPELANVRLVPDQSNPSNFSAIDEESGQNVAQVYRGTVGYPPKSKWFVILTDGSTTEPEGFIKLNDALDSIKGNTTSYVNHLPEPTSSSFLNSDTGSSTTAFAARTGLGAAAGAGIAESQGEDWKKGAAVGGVLGAGMPLLTKGAQKLTHGGMGGSVTENVGDSSDEAMQALFKAMNDARKESGGRTFASMDEAIDSISKAGNTGKIKPSHPSPNQALPGFGTEVGGEQLGVFSNPASPSMADKPRLTPTGARRDIVGSVPEGTSSPRPPGVSEGRSTKNLELIAQRPETPGTRQTLEKNILGILGVPMEVFVGGDISAGGRQARALGQSHPVLWAESIAKGIQAMDSNKAEELINVMRGDRDLRVLTEFGNLHLSFLQTEEQLGAGLAARGMEKAGQVVRDKVGGKLGSFLASPTEYLPATERNYAMTLDWLRYTVGKQLLDDFRKSGVEIDKELVTKMTNYINHKTGYGTGRVIDAAHGTLSVPFLAPRYWLSKYQSMGDTFTMFANTPAMRPEIVKNTVSYLGTIAAISALSAYVGGETGIFQDPLKGAFGSVGGKDLSFDITGGMATELRNVGRIVAGATVNAKGEEKSLDRSTAIGKFLRGKASPNAGTLYSLITGKDYNGDPANLKSLEGAKNLARGSVIPLFYQDTYTSFQKEYPGVVHNESEFGRLLSAARLLAGVGGSAFGVAPHVELDNRYDKRADRFKGMFPGSDWEHRTPTQQTAYEAKYGKVEPTSKEAIAAQENRDRQHRDNVAAQEVIDMKFPPGADWRKARSDNMIAVATKILENEARDPYMGKSSDSTDSVNVKTWLDKFKELTPYPGGTNYDAMEKWLAENPTISDSVDRYMSDPNKPSTALTARDMEYKKDSKVIRESGYWELKDSVWEKVLAAQPNQLGYTPGQTYDQYRDAMIDKVADTLIKSGTNPTVAKDMAVDKVGDIFPGIGLMDDIYTKQVLIPWIAKHPEEFYLIAKWEYIRNPNKTEAAILNALEQQKKSQTPKPTEIK